MKTLIFFVLLILLLGIANAQKGNVDIMKKTIIEKCEEINEIGDCIIIEEIDPIPNQATRTFVRFGLSAANSFGINEAASLIIFVLFLGAAFIVLAVLLPIILSGAGVN